jgi:hypothetical protein
MPNPPEIGTHRLPAPERDEGDDGVVLYDPTAREELPDFDGAGGGAPSLNPVLVVLFLLAAGLGAYQLFFRPDAAAVAADPEPAFVAPEFAPVEEALTPLGDTLWLAEAGSQVTLAVRAQGAGGAPLADSLVQFTVISGDAMLSADTTRTDRDGVARVDVELSPEAGANLVHARMAASNLETRIRVIGRPGPPARLVISGGNGQEAEVGEIVPARPTVLVTDTLGNPIPRAEVLFAVVTGQGQVAPSREFTDSSGIAEVVWRLGVEMGTQELEATVRSIGTSVTFRANALGLPAQIQGAPRTLERGPVVVVPHPFVVGGSLVCELEAGAAQCRGANDRGQAGSRAVTGLTALAAGVSHVCGLNPSGDAVCWGANDGGQLGDGSRTDRETATPVRAEIQFSVLTAGAAHTCGIAGGGIAACWGQNLSGQLGNGSRTDARFPIAVGGGMLFRTLVAGWYHTCGLTANGSAFCWGPNSDGQLGDGSRVDRLTPTLVRGTVRSLAAGSHHTCGINASADGVLCWGDSRFGQVGDGTNESRAQPTEVVGLPGPATQIAAGAVHTCALVADGSAYCWGQNRWGQLGDGTTQNRNQATPVAGGLRFRSIHAGGALTCGITLDGEQYCWGFNQDGQLGDGTREHRSSPVRIPG